MIDARIPFLNKDGTVSREWYLFLSLLNVAVGGTNVINVLNIPDAQVLQEIEESSDESPNVPVLTEQVRSIERLLWGNDDLQAGFATLQDAIDGQVRAALDDDMPAGFATTQAVQTNNVLTWLNI